MVSSQESIFISNNFSPSFDLVHSLMSQDLKLAGSSANYHPRNNFLYIGKWKGGGQGGFTHMRAIKFNFFKLFSPCILLHCAGQESWKVDREILNSMHKLCCWNCNAVRRRAH